MDAAAVAILGSGILADGARVQRECAGVTVTDATAFAIGSVDRTIAGDGDIRQGSLVVIVEAAAEGGAVVTEGRVADGERTTVVDAATKPAGGHITADRAVADYQCSCVVDAATVSITDRAARDRDGRQRHVCPLVADGKDLRLLVAADSGAPLTGTVDGDGRCHGDRERSQCERVGIGGYSDREAEAGRLGVNLLEGGPQCAVSLAVGTDTITGRGVVGIGGAVHRKGGGYCGYGRSAHQPEQAERQGAAHDKTQDGTSQAHSSPLHHRAPQAPSHGHYTRSRRAQATVTATGFPLVLGAVGVEITEHPHQEYGRL
ncbi:MAG: hypothetical protein M1298_00065 [Chloroflexi bacterium]|nr:hypothetical protein [Chloroflexota bacterium]